MSTTVDALSARFKDAILSSHEQHGDATVLVAKEKIHDVLGYLRNDHPTRFDQLIDVCGSDGLELSGLDRPERFEVIYHLRSMEKGERLRVKAPVSESDCEIDSISDLWAAANWAEREVFDMFGVRFRNHPNLKRLLCFPSFEGHALRKDYDIRHQQWLLGEPQPFLDEIGEIGESPEDGGFSELIPVNLGPAHPAMHGTLRTMVKLDGERIVSAAQEIGYLHRGFEKHAENSSWTQVVPYTDRLNYCSAMLNNVGYCLAVEKLLDMEIPERTQYIRVIISEISRIIDHLVCIGAMLVDLGALTNFWYLFAMRERAYEVLEALCGARLTSSYVRIGGLSDDLNPGFEAGVRGLLQELPEALNDVLALIQKNRIFLDRVRDIGVVSGEQAVDYGWAGPCLRASGVSYDLRRDDPYLVYPELEFEIPTRKEGDVHARLMVRFDEIVQSMRMIEQCLDKMPEGPIFTDDKRVVKPDKLKVYNNIEALMNHFVLVYDGIKVPAGEAYSAVEGANGELGFYAMSDGSGRPWRVRCRPPSLYLFSAYGEVIRDHMIADAVAILGSLNIIAGELDR